MIDDTTSAGPRAAALQGLAESSLELDDVLASLEHEFLVMSDSIEAATSCGEELLAASEELHGLALGRDGGQCALGQASEALRAPLDYLATSGRRTDRVIELLREYHAGLRRTLAWERESRRTLAPLSYVQTLFRIEASRLDVNVARTLLSLVVDIDVLQRRVEDVFGEKFNELRDTHASLGTLVTSLVRQAETHTSASSLRHAEIERAIVSLHDSIARADAREMEVAGITRDIIAATGRLVMALQFQDIVSQKIAHAKSASADIAAIGATLDDEVDPKRHAEVHALVEYAARVVLAQLDAAHVEVMDADTNIDAAVAIIVARVGDLDRECVAMNEIDVVSVSTDGLVQVMLDAIGQVRELLAAGTALVRETTDVVAPIAATATNVTHRMAELAHGMLIIGLNAEVQAAHAGAGGGLEVLSARTSGIATETRHVSSSVAEEINSLIAGLEEVSHILAELARDGASSTTLLDEEGTAAERDLHGFRNRALTALARVAAVSGGLTDRMRPIAERRRFSDAFTRDLAPFRDAVQQVVEYAEQTASTSDVVVDLDAVTSEMRARYTMASERRIHDATLRHMHAGPRRTLRSGSDELFADTPAPSIDMPELFAMGAPVDAASHEAEVWL